MNGTSDLSDAISKLFIGPDTIFSGKVKMLNANIFDTTDITSISDINNMTVNKADGTISYSETIVEDLADAVSPGYKLIVNIREAIASIYTTIRDVCGYIMLAGLIFTGIKILVGSNIPSKNTRWLEALQDWLIGMALLIFSHIIMIVLFKVSDLLTNALSTSLTGFGSINFTLISQCLLSWDSAEQIVYLIMLGYLIYLTVIFAVSYFKRLMWICVLIVIAPIVSIMYAFGQSGKRIYSNWFREYILGVLVQPFHLIVYYILVSVPLNMVNSSGGFDLMSNGFEIIYALGAMSFIRPAEKYVRQLFGMDKGIADMASFDSGKKTITDAKNMVEDFGKKLVGVVQKVAAVAFAVYTGGAGAAAIGGTSTAVGAESVASTGATGGGLLGTGAAGGVEASEGLSGMTGMENLGEGAGNLLDFGTTGQEEPAFSLSSSSIGGAIDDLPDEDPLSLSRRESLEEQLADGQISKEDLSLEDRQLLGLDDKLNSTEDAEEELSQVSEGLKEASEELKDGAMAANNVIITATNVNMQGDIDNMETDNIKTVDGEKEDLEDVQEDNEDIKLPPIQPDLFGALKTAGVGEDLRDLGNTVAKGRDSLASGFYLKGTEVPTAEWSNKRQREDSKIKEKREKRKQKNEEEKTKWSKDKNNINFIINEKKYMERFREQYPNKSEAFIRNMAEERAEKDLQKMSDYVPYGVRDVRQAYEYSKLAKDYGYTPEQAIRANAGYEKFNKDPENIAHISQVYNVNVDSVSEAIPDAKEYYHNGYDNISDMQWVDAMAAKLNKGPDYAMDIDRALRKKGGKIKYNGNNDELKDVINQINEHYRK